MDPKRITRFKFMPGGPIKIETENQLQEKYELDASINILKLIDTGERDHLERAVMEVHLAVSYTSYPKEEPPPGAPIGPLRQVPFVPAYPGPARVQFKDQEERDCELEVTPVVVRVDDTGQRDALRRSAFNIHVAAHHAHVKPTAAASPPTPARIHVSGA